MDVYKFMDDLPEFENAVLTIGTFDGVHVGHQKILSRINEMAAEIYGESVLLTFHPHPRLVLNPDDDSLKLINTLDEKIELLEQYGINNLIIASFTEDFSHTEPEQYVKDFLIKKIHPKKIIIGYDHHFGRDRKGNIGTLKMLQDKYGYEIEEIPKQLIEHIAVSSTKIRKSIQHGEMELANELLGHYFSMEGKVIKGNQIGNQLGFPTANIFIENKNKLIPGEGVYAAYVYFNDGLYKGMLYIGNRPTFSGRDKSIEINIFDLDEDLYGKHIKLEVVAEIRKDEKFESAEALKAQLLKDKEATLARLRDIPF